jgi:hypothetical protein
MISHRCWNSVQFTASACTDHLTIYLNNHLVYYRLYSRDTAIPSKHPIFSNDRYIGRIDAIHVPPPHNAESIKRCIAIHEDIDHRCILLFSVLSSDTPISDQDRVPILAGTGSGSTPQEPMALVVGEVSDLVNANNSIKDGTYAIRTEKGYIWNAVHNPIQNIYTSVATIDEARSYPNCQVSLSSLYQSLSYACSTI